MVPELGYQSLLSLNILDSSLYEEKEKYYLLISRSYREHEVKSRAFLTINKREATESFLSRIDINLLRRYFR